MTKVRLTWVPGHSGVRGNEDADRLALRGSKERPVGPEHIVGLVGAVGSAIVDRIFWRRSDIVWEEAGGMRQSRCLIDFFPRNKSKSLMELSRKDLRCVTGLLREDTCTSGHHRIRSVACFWKTRKLRYMFSHSARYLRRSEKSFGVIIISHLDIQGTRPRRLCGFVRATVLERY